MLRNYLLTAWRNLLHNRVYSVINIAGLSLGLTCVMLIVLYVKDEVSYDRFHKGVENIYRITIGSDDPRFAGMHMGITGLMQGPRFSAKVPGIQAFVRVGKGQADVRMGDGVHSVPYIYVDSNFFSVFSFPLLGGDARTALSGPGAVVLSEDAARRQFGTVDAVGKVIYLKEDSGFVPYKVTAVARRVPQNSSIQFDMVKPLIEAKGTESNEMNWFTFFLTTYVVLDPYASQKVVEAGMLKVYRQDAAEMIAQAEKQSKMEDKTRFGLQPFANMHLGNKVSQEEVVNPSNPVYSYLLSGIAVFILLIAAINFVNLTVARSLKRAKEIGVRKVLGGERRQIMLQFLGEAFLLCLVAFISAIFLVRLVLPLFNQLSNKELSLAYLMDARLIGMYIGIFFLTVLLAGFYPALVISGFNPVRALYSRQTLGGRSWLQRSLVVVQFGFASFLIIGTFVIYLQFHYLTTEKLGYDDSGLVVLNKERLTGKEVKILRQALMKDADISGMAPKDADMDIAQTSGKINGDSGIIFDYATVDEAFLPLLKIPLVKGRNFSPLYPMDSARSVVVNEAFVRAAGWKDPIGKEVRFFDDHIFTVIGVIRDYHYEGLQRKIIPELLTMRAGVYNNDLGTIYVKTRPGTATSSLRHIEKTFRALFPMSPYSYVFKDEENIRQYASEERWKQIILAAAILTIFISCIGLFGLSVLAAERRTKEIGIRKVLGASVISVVRMLATDFVLLVGIALLVAVPAAWLVASRWLANYPYRIGLDVWIFGGAGLVVVGIAAMTVSFQAVRAGRANPVRSLRVD